MAHQRQNAPEAPVTQKGQVHMAKPPWDLHDGFGFWIALDGQCGQLPALLSVLAAPTEPVSTESVLFH